MLGEGLEEGFRQLVGSPVELGALGEARGGETRDTDAAVALVRLDGHEPIGLEAPQQSAQVAGVELEPRAKRPHVAALGADLPEQPRLAQRTPAREVVLVERSDALGDHAVEAPELRDHRRVDSLTLVRETPQVNARPAPRRAAARFRRAPV